MAGGEPVTTAGPPAPVYPYAESPNTYPARSKEELEQRRKRYSWLYDDEDLWATGDAVIW